MPDTNISILVADPFSIAGVQLLQRELPDVRICEHIGLKPDQLRSIIHEYTVLIVRSQTRVTADLLAVAPNLKVVARAGVGLDNIDIEAAQSRGVTVVNSPAGNIEAVAEHTIAMMLALARHIPSAHASMASGKWEKPRFMGTGVRAKTLGILGLGKVGSLVAELATGLRMHVMAYDPFLLVERLALLQEIGGTYIEHLDDLLVRADFLSLHAALPAGSSCASHSYIIGSRELRLVKPTAFLINCARGGLVDEQALLCALQEYRLAGAALDVFSQEPVADSTVLRALLTDPHVIATPHLGGSTREAQANVALDVARQLVHVLKSLYSAAASRQALFSTVM
jgi:D-3-phosphoglycerate dehydrogenase / 2-oxoglutarate reductase